MKKTFALILICFLLPIGTWADDGAACDTTDFEGCYQKYWVESVCKAPSSPWNKEKGVGDVSEGYALFDVQSQNQKMRTLINTEKNPSEQAKLEKDLDPSRIGLFDGFKSVEIARIQYRTNMNRIWSCAVITSRIEKTKKIIEMIPASESSDILKKLGNDMKKLNALKPPNCGTNSDPDKNTDYARAVSSSALTEYCSYTNYLDYLQSNINADYSRVVTLEQKIGNGGEGKKMPETMMSVARAMNIRTVQIQSDVDRATSTLQKSAVAYREMERTYMLHVILLIIYDDYLELRQNMNTYLNAVSQLFEKAKNAQSANQ